MGYIVLINFIVLSTFGSANLGHGAISKNVESSFVDNIVVNILRRCFISEATDIGLIGKSDPIFTVKTTLFNSVATVLIDDPETARKGDDEASASYPHGLPIFVMSVSEDHSVEKVLVGLKDTRWWNHAAAFIILDRRASMAKVSCIANARELLLTTWKEDILSSIFLCTNNTYDGREANSIFMYTYNPYDETAPKPWRKVDIRTSSKGHPWTLFEQAYDSDKTSCESIKFLNKTLNLKGFKISANAKSYPPFLTVPSVAKTINDLGGVHAPAIQTIWRKLNASMSLITYDINRAFGDSFENGSAVGMIADIFSGKCDINLNLRYIRRQRGINFSVAQTTGALWIVTNHRGWKSPLKKITDFIKFKLILAVFLVCFVVVLVIGYTPPHFVLPDLMNVLRLFLSSGMYHLPRSTPQRLLLFATTLMVLVFSSVFQGNIAGLLTSRISRQQVETLDDIDQFGYELYGFEYLAEFIPLHLLKKFHNSGIYYLGFCSEILAHHRNAACFAQEADVIVLIAKQNLHIPKTKFINFHTSYMIRKDWPLYERFNRLAERAVNSGLTSYWESKVTSNFQEGGVKMFDQAIRALEYRDLKFAFKILAFDLTLASLVFIYEYFLARRIYEVMFKLFH